MPELTDDDYRQALKILGLKCGYSFDKRDSALFFCVYHKDSHPSLGFNFHKGIYNCFQCGRSGTISSFVKERTGKSIFQLLGKSDDYEIFNLTSPKEIPYTRTVIHPLDIRGVLLPYYESKDVLDYLEYRGISKAVADSLHMKYCKEIYANTSHLKDRLIIPIYDDKNQLINLEARAIHGEEKKCLYPKNSVKPLFEWYKLDKNKTLFVFEGLVKMSVARVDPYFTNSSATLGSNITEYQLRQLNEFSHIIYVRDMDKASEKTINKIKENYKGNFQVLLTADDRVKDVDEIPTKLHMTVEEFRKQGKFIMDII